MGSENTTYKKVGFRESCAKTHLIKKPKRPKQPLGQLNDAVRALHTAYGLDSDQVEAVVYGGTGR